MATIKSPEALRFGLFEVDCRSGELRKRGHKLKLPHQSFQILAMLLERPGEVVTREEIQKRLWPSDTVVEFEHSINAAIRRLCLALGDSAKIPRFVETLARRGYRFVAALEAGGAELSFERSGTGSIRALAVLPLENGSHNPEQEYFVDGMTEALITNLSKVLSLRVISRTSVMQFKGVHKPLPEIARTLNVGAVMEGSVLCSGDRVRITAHLIDAMTDQHLWAETYERDLSDVLSLQSAVATAICREIQVRLTPEEESRLTSAGSIHPEAHEFYLKGRYYWHKWTEEGWRKSCEYFQQAISKDPAYALAYVGLAEAYCQLGLRGVLPPDEVMPKAKEAAKKALEIDDLLANAYTALGTVNAYFDWDWVAAEVNLKRACEISPSFGSNVCAHAILLVWLGRFDQAIAEIQQLRQRDQLSLPIILAAGWIHYFAGHYDDAIEQYRSIIEMDPYFAAAHWLLGESYVQNGRDEAAIEEYQTALALSEDRDAKAALGHVYGITGRRSEAMSIARELEATYEQAYVHPGAIALVYNGLGDKEKVLHWLETAYQRRSHSILFAKFDPRYDTLRGEPLFRELLQGWGIPP